MRSRGPTFWSPIVVRVASPYVPGYGPARWSNHVKSVVAVDALDQIKRCDDPCYRAGSSLSRGSLPQKNSLAAELMGPRVNLASTTGTQQHAA